MDMDITPKVNLRTRARVVAPLETPGVRIWLAFLAAAGLLTKCIHFDVFSPAS